MMKVVVALCLFVCLAVSYPMPGKYGGGGAPVYNGGGGYGGGGGGGYGGGYNDYSEPRDYRFNYYVNDDYTYNHQTRNENKYGNTVTGQYTLVEPTGQLRVVDYIADDYGFRANVQHQPNYQNKAY